MQRHPLPHLIIVLVMASVSFHTTFGGGLELPEAEDLFIKETDTYFLDINLTYRDPPFGEPEFLITYKIHAGKDIPESSLAVYFNLSYANLTGTICIGAGRQVFLDPVEKGTANITGRVPHDPGLDRPETLFLETYLEVRTDQGEVILDRATTSFSAKDIGMPARS